MVVSRPLPVDTEMTALCFWFNNYVNIRQDPLSSRGFLEHMLPVYSRVRYDSPLSLTTLAIAFKMAGMWSLPGKETGVGQKAITKALMRTRTAVSDPEEALKDETLLTVLMLGFTESLGSSFNNIVPSGTHQNGAVALIKHRGARNFRNPLAKRLLVAVRSQIVRLAVQKEEAIAFDPDVWSDLEDMPENPITDLDRLIAIFAAIQAEERRLTDRKTSLDPWDPKMTVEDPNSTRATLFTKAVELDAELSVWPNSIPEQWHPVSVSSENLYPSIVAAGLYGDYCHVYHSIHVVHNYNLWRTTRLSLLNIILRCCTALGDDPTFINTAAHATKEQQKLVDDICASIPFHLGDRVVPLTPNDAGLARYPQVSFEQLFDAGWPVDEALRVTSKNGMDDHARGAATVGGWFLLNTFLALIHFAKPEPETLPEDIRPPLRDGQFLWIMGQFQRLGRLYMSKNPPKQAVGSSG